MLLHLADCHERIGRVASAWAEFTDAVELAHRKGDNRESLAQQRADALKPKLAHLHLAPPASPPPNLLVRRDGVDITVLVGTDIPIDPGEHELTANAPGFLEWRKKITIGALPTTTQLDIPALDKAPENAPPPPPSAPATPKDGKLAVESQPDAQIFVDDQPVGTGRYEHAVTPGRHTLRVTAPDTHPYQTELYILDGENRSIDVPLEHVQRIAPAEDLPGYEVALGFGSGEISRADHPTAVAYRFDFGFRFHRRINFGAFVEYASISATGSCGTDIPGPTPATPYDYGMRTQFNGCRYVMPGLQLLVHVRPQEQLDPWIGVTPGFRFEFVDVTPYSPAGMPTNRTTQTLLGIPIDVRAGLDYHPTPQMPGLAIGAFVDVQVSVKADENYGNNKDNKDDPYLSIFGGLRSSLAF